MADDLASQLAAAIVTAAVRAAAQHSDWPVASARTELARDLDLILSVHLPQLTAPSYACPDYTPDERHRHAIGGQTWEHAHEGGHETHSAVCHDLSDAERVGPSYECPHGDPLCPCLGLDHQRAAEDARAHARADADLIAAARSLRSESGENPEYDRALVELIRDTIGGEYADIARAIDLRGDSFVQQVTR